MKVFDSCNWAVCYTIPAETQDDRKPGITVCAWFNKPFLAYDFIDKVLPQGNRYRFSVIHRDELEKDC